MIAIFSFGEITKILCDKNSDMPCPIDSYRVSKHRNFIRCVFGWFTGNEHKNFRGLRKEYRDRVKAHWTSQRKKKERRCISKKKKHKNSRGLRRENGEGERG